MHELKEKIKALGINIGIYATDFETDYISLTDIARYKNSENPKEVINNWMRSQRTLDFLLTWEKLYNENFKGVHLHTFKNGHVQMSPEKYIRETGSLGIVIHRGRYGGGTFAHKDIAFEFASWISPEFKLYIIKDYQRLKTLEAETTSKNWNLRREISKLNYEIHTDAIKTRLAPFELRKEQLDQIYANEADVLNIALFGMTAKEFHDNNPERKGNLRDYASIEQLLVLSNLESYNSILINQGISQRERLILLRDVVNSQLKILLESKEKNILNNLL